MKILNFNARKQNLNSTGEAMCCRQFGLLKIDDSVGDEIVIITIPGSWAISNAPPMPQ